ncbi:MAG: response regulator, partial [Pseudanabaenaceae cyanobacterium]
FTDTETGAEEGLAADWSRFPEPATPPEAPEEVTAEPVLAEALETLAGFDPAEAVEALEDLSFFGKATVAESEGEEKATAPVEASAAGDICRESTEDAELGRKADEETSEISLDSLLLELDAALPDIAELSPMISLDALTSYEPSAILSAGDVTDLEQTLATEEPAILSLAEFESLNFDLSDNVEEHPETPEVSLGASSQVADLAAIFENEPPPLPKAPLAQRPVFSGPESIVLTTAEAAPASFFSYQLYDAAADLVAGQIALNCELQQLRATVRSLLGITRSLGAPLESPSESLAPSGVLPEELLRLREISEDIDLALFEMEQGNADRQRQIWHVQELAREERLCTLGSLGKQLIQDLRPTAVQLNIENSTVAIDRTFANQLAALLEDLCKLLVERSIESPSERQRLGKPAIATLRMRGIAVGDTLNLEITDDGAGLPFDIFQPGAPGATIAHRCRALGIALRPDFVSSQGSRINLQLPYVLLMTRVLLLRIGAAMVAVRTEHVRDILPLPPGDGRTVIWGHRTIPWVNNAQERLRVNCRRQELPVFEVPAQENVLVVLQSENHPYALTVNACWHEQEATLQRLPGVMTLPFPFCGCAVLADGRVIPLLAPAELLLQPNEENTQLRLLEKQKRQSAREILSQRSPQLILLVDDSINVRRYLASLLEGAGFATVQARDGAEALEKLENGLQPRAIISDLEMPRMDGYTLLQRVRTREISRNVPFVVLTSRTNERHRQRAQELGATAYINKPYRNEELVSLIQRLTAPATER